ncbi:hypothetical protein ACFQGT_03855 [Natrialbaceae archaeon GCM10025810]|uniref:hypothetical protein n=1 Tax=Halovalidus salilacus TaxID=3075124 RepID=UPI0036203EC5
MTANANDDPPSAEGIPPKLAEALALQDAETLLRVSEYAGELAVWRERTGVDVSGTAGYPLENDPEPAIDDDGDDSNREVDGAREFETALEREAETACERGSETAREREAETELEAVDVAARERADESGDRFPTDVPPSATETVDEIGGTEYRYYQWREGDEIKSKTVKRRVHE